MRNLEQKFHCHDAAAAEAAAKALGATDRGILHQHDYFFPAPDARLKLRISDGREGAELIAYRRKDVKGACESDYTIAPIADTAALIVTLTHALGAPSELVKTRHLYLYQATRIHIDNVVGLGTFVEFETMLTTQTAAEAEAELKVVVHAMNLTEAIATAYVDMLPQPKE